MTLPMARLPLRVLEPPCVLAREADDDDVLPAILVDVLREGEKVVRVIGDVEWFWRIKFKPLGECRSGIPKRARHDIHRAVAIEVAEAGPFAEKLICKLRLLERMQLVLVCRDCIGYQNQQQSYIGSYHDFITKEKEGLKQRRRGRGDFRSDVKSLRPLRLCVRRFGLMFSREIGQSPNLAAGSCRFVRQNADGCPIRTRRRVGPGIAIVQKRTDKFVDQMRVRTAVTRAL